MFHFKKARAKNDDETLSECVLMRIHWGRIKGKTWWYSSSFTFKSIEKISEYFSSSCFFQVWMLLQGGYRGSTALLCARLTIQFLTLITILKCNVQFDSGKMPKYTSSVWWEFVFFIFCIHHSHFSFMKFIKLGKNSKNISCPEKRRKWGKYKKLKRHEDQSEIFCWRNIVPNVCSV